MIKFEIEQFMKEFKIHNDKILGQGHDANVYLVQRQDKTQSSIQLFALKCSNIQDDQHLQNFQNEVFILCNIQQHPFIIEIYGYSNDNSCILLEYMPYDNLFKYIQQTIPQNITKTIVYYLFDALLHIHNKGYVHGDIKPENILISSQYIPKLSDFGFSRTINQPLIGGSQGYTAPEVYFNNKNYNTTKADIFSMGVLLFVMSIGYRPFIWNKPNQSDELWLLIVQQKWNKFWNVFDQVKKIDTSLKQLLQSILEPNNELRISIQDIINHEYFKEGLVDLNTIQQYFKSKQ